MKEKQKQILSEMLQEDEIIEQFAIKYSNMHQDVSSTLGKYLVKAVFKDGAIWQQKQNSDKKYSEDELLNILNEYNYAIINEDRINTIGTVKKWLEQFSKLKNG